MYSFTLPKKASYNHIQYAIKLHSPDNKTETRAFNNSKFVH